MAKYRFKTEQEFRKCNKWGSNYPIGWTSDMRDKYLGRDIPDQYNKYCDRNDDFSFTAEHGNWYFSLDDYVLNETHKNVSGFKLEDVKEIQI